MQECSMIKICTFHPHVKVRLYFLKFSEDNTPEGISLPRDCLNTVVLEQVVLLLYCVSVREEYKVLGATGFSFRPHPSQDFHVLSCNSLNHP